MKTKLFILCLALAACKKDTPQPAQASASSVDTVRITVFCMNAPTQPPPCVAASLSGLVSYSSSCANYEGEKKFANVPYGTIYYTGTHGGNIVSGEFTVTATQKIFSVAVPY